MVKTTRIASTLIASVLVVGALGVAPARATAPGGSHPAIQDTAPVNAAGAHDLATKRSALSGLFDGYPVTPRRMFDAMLGQMTAPRERGGAGMTLVAGGDSSSSDPSSTDPSSTDFSVFPFLQADVNGDGKDDVFAFEGEWDNSRVARQRLRVRARSGADGHLLWSTPTFLDEPFSSSTAPTGYAGGGWATGTGAEVGDLFGDGEVEILVLETGYTISEPLTMDATILQRLSLFSGRDGSLEWTRDFSGKVTLVGEDQSFWFPLPVVRATATVSQTRNFLTGINYIEDANGDGRGDLFLPFWDFTEAQSPVGSHLVSLTDRGVTVDGRTGATVATVSREAREYESLIPVQDISGDGTQDLLALSSSTLEAHSFDLATMYWSVSLPKSSYVSVFAGTYTGRGRDVVVDGLTSDPVSGFNWRRTVYFGSSGRVAWTRTTTGGFQALGDTQHRGASDLLEIAWTGPATVVATAYSGVDAHQLWAITETAHATDGVPEMLFSWLVLDLTGDGIGELRFAPWVHTAPDSSGRVATLRVGEFALDGSDRHLLWDTGPRASFDNLPRPIDDTDGDGRLDLVSADFVPRAQTYDAVLHLERGYDDAPLWDATRPDSDPEAYMRVSVADMVGDAAPDLLVGYRLLSDTEVDLNEISVFGAGGDLAWRQVVTPQF